MKKIRERCFVLLLSVCMVVGMLPTVAFAATAPKVVSATTTVDGTQIKVTFDKAMADPSGKHGVFEFSDGGLRGFSAAALDSDTKTIVLTVDGTPIAHGATVTLRCTVGVIKAADGGVLATFSGQDVTNAVPAPAPPEAPKVVSATTTVDGTQIKVTFNKAMADPSGKHGAFSFNDGELRGFSAAALDSDTKTIVLTVDGTPIAHGATVTLRCTVGVIKAADGGVLATFTGQDVTNAVPAPQPPLNGVTTPEGLKAALEAATPDTINVTADITMNDSIAVGADHVLNIADGKTVFTGNSNLIILDGNTLTLSGIGVLEANNTQELTEGIYVSGTLKLSGGSKLVASNNAQYSVGIRLDGGKLEGNGGIITIKNDGQSEGISGNGNINDRATFSGGSLTVENTGRNSTGIAGIDMTISDSCVFTVKNTDGNGVNNDDKPTIITDSTVSVANTGRRGLVAGALTITGSTVHIANSGNAIIGLDAKLLTVEDSTMTVANSKGSGIRISDLNQKGSFHLKNSTLKLENTADTGLLINDDEKLTVDNSTVTITANGGIGLSLNDSVTAIGANGGKLTLVEGARLTGVKNFLSDQGFTYKYGGTVTVSAADLSASADRITAGDYVWNGTLFAKGGTPTVNDAETPTITRQPQGVTVKVGQSVTLSVEASVNDGGTLSYQWRGGSNTELSTKIDGATSANFTPPTTSVGTMYYVCVVTNTNNSVSGNKTARIFSNQVAVTVQSDGSSSSGGGGSSSGGGGSSSGGAFTTPDTENQGSVNTSNGAVTLIQGSVNTANGTVTFQANTQNIGNLIEENKGLTLKSSLLDFQFDTDSLKTIQNRIGSGMQVDAQRVRNLSQANQSLIGNRPVYDIKLTGNNGRAITSFGNSFVLVSIPYKLQAGEKAENLVVYYIEEGGKANLVANSFYNQKDGMMMMFKTNHFSIFGIGYKEPVKFTDTEGHWAEEDIYFVVNRGLFSGTTATTFAPNTAMTRGMFVTVLGRLAGINPDDYTHAKFKDVKANAYYAPYVNWAAEKGIVSGTSKTTFSPDSNITREQMAVIMKNYAEKMGYTLPQTLELMKFTDEQKISSWASDAVKQMQQAGILSGKKNYIFDPEGKATRAEVSAILHRFVKIFIDPQTANG